MKILTICCPNCDYYQPSRLLPGLALILLSMVTAVGNGMVLHAIRTEKRLQTVSNMFIMSLAVADLIVGLIVMPISAIDFIADSGQGTFLLSYLRDL